MPGAESSSAEARDEAGGFRVSGAPQTALHIRMWGYWGPEVATAFARDAPAACSGLSAAAALILDASELKPQGAEGQEALRVWLRSVAGLSFAHAKVIAGNVLTRMQLTRLLRECGVFERSSFTDQSI